MTPKRRRQILFFGMWIGTIAVVVAVAYAVGGPDEPRIWFARIVFILSAFVQTTFGLAIWWATRSSPVDRWAHWRLACSRLLLAAALVLGSISTFSGADFRIVFALFAASLVLGWSARRGLTPDPRTTESSTS